MTIKNIQNFAFQNNLWKKNDKIIVGISGGPDSVCLLDIFSKLAKKYDFEIRIAHVNYGLRGDDSQKDENFVRKLARKYNLQIDILTVEKEEIGKENLENTLRKIRYNFFEKIRKKYNFDLIAVAHNKDDQAETVLMNILRGSGLQGMKAMRPKSESIIRPLLKTSRKEIEIYLKKNKLNYRIDTTNKDIRFQRNKIRNRLIPYLERNYNRNIKDTLLTLSLNTAQDYDYISQETKKVSQEIITQKETKVILDMKKFNKLPTALKKESIRQAITLAKKTSDNITLNHIEEVLKIIRSKKNKPQEIQFLNLKISKENDNIAMLSYHKK